MAGVSFVNTGVILEVDDPSTTVLENEESVEVCVQLTSSLSLVMRNVTIDVLIEPGTVQVYSVCTIINDRPLNVTIY
jgi:hypothetical protein